MLTVGQALFFAVIFSVILCIAAGILFWNFGFRMGAAQGANEGPRATVTVYDERQEFMETKRFATVYDALSYIQLYNSRFDLTLTVHRPSGGQITLQLVRIGA
jgi:hypothetical protein